MEKEQTVDGDRLNEPLTSVDIPGFVVTTANWDVLTFWDNNSAAFSQELNLGHAGKSLEGYPGEWTVVFCQGGWQILFKTRS